MTGPITETAESHRSADRKSYLRILLEVVLISVGVFLGLLGDQWRENSEHRDMARASLRRFRAEIAANRKALADQLDYHAAKRRELDAFFSRSGPKTAATFNVQFAGLGPVFFEQTAWDLAIATQSLAHIKEDLAFALSRAYTAQRSYTAQQAAIVQSTIYGRSMTRDFEGYWRSIYDYYGDVTVLDPALLKLYDTVLPRIDSALGATKSTQK